MLAFDPSEISEWAKRSEAPNQLPDLVRRLILATTPMPPLLAMPAGSGVRLPGWDGIVTVPAGNPWVPKGTSAWEISVQQDPKRKADEDYRKRTANPLGLAVPDVTLVIVTACQWADKQSWVEKRRGECKWASVRAYDASDLALWLEQAPVVADWFARLIGKLPESDCESLTSWWEHWTKTATPALTPDLVIAGRSQVATALGEWAQGDPSQFYLRGCIKDEAVAFLAASALANSDPWGAALMERAVVVKSADAWRQLERHRPPLALIRYFDGEATPIIAVQAGHHTLSPLHEAQDVRGKGHTLPKPDHDKMLPALTDMGISDQHARALVRQTDRRLPIIRRLLIEDAGAPPPHWALPQAYPWLPPLALIGQWNNDNKSDREIVAGVAGQPYEDVESNIAELMQTEEPPFTAVGALRRFTCHEEAYHLLAPRLTASAVNRFESAAVGVLGAVSPQFELPADKQYPASIYGKTLPHSGTIREGIARGLALLGTSQQQDRRANGAEQLASRAVSAIFANSSGWQIWATLSWQLPTLAEAAPDVLLNAIENAIATAPHQPVELFAQEGDPLFGGTPHAGLLSALERLGWCEDYFTRVAVALAQLADIDPGGHWLNSPASSLTSFFRPWIRFSEAEDCQRLATLQTLCERTPGAAWRLLISVYPKHLDGVAVGRDTPHWRPWAQDGAPPVSRQEYWSFVKELEWLLLTQVGSDAERWSELVGIMPFWSLGGMQLATDALTQRIATLRAHPASHKLWTELRRILHLHRSYADSEWAMSPEVLLPLADAYEALTPSDPVAAYAWLFTWWPELPEGIQEVATEARDALQLNGGRIATAQQAAIQSVIAAGGSDAVVAIAEAAEHPFLVGRSVALSDNTELTHHLAMQYAGSETESHRQMAKGIMRVRYEQSGWAGIEKIIHALKSAHARPMAIADAYLTAMEEQQVWAVLEGETTAAQTAYWQSFSYHQAMRDTPANKVYVARKLIEVNRSPYAVDRVLYDGAPDEIVIAALAALPRDLDLGTIDGATHQVLPHHVEKLLEQLDQSEHIGEDLIAELEIPLLGILRDRRHKLAIQRQISQHPELWADLVALVYRRTDGQPDAITENPALAYKILTSARVCPGTTPDGRIDDEALSAWVSEAHRLCRERDREAIGDECIGHLLANAPAGKDGIWPCEPVRGIIEKDHSGHITTGAAIGIHNLRGVTLRGVRDGGSQERSLAEKYRANARAITGRWPNTARMLNRIAAGYGEEASWHYLESARFDEFGFYR